MGANGVDVMLSPAAERVFNQLAIECKWVETLNVYGTFIDHAAKYPNEVPLLIHRKNRKIPLVTMKFTDFLRYLTGDLAIAKP